MSSNKWKQWFSQSHSYVRLFHLIKLLSSYGVAFLISYLVRARSERWWQVAWRAAGGNLITHDLMTSNLVQQSLRFLCPSFLLSHQEKEERRLSALCFARWNEFRESQRQFLLIVMEELDRQHHSFNAYSTLSTLNDQCRDLRIMSRFPLRTHLVNPDRGALERLFAPFAINTQTRLWDFVNYMKVTSRLSPDHPFTTRKTLYFSGPSGTGKTFSVVSLARILGVPLLRITLSPDEKERTPTSCRPAQTLLVDESQGIFDPSSLFSPASSTSRLNLKKGLFQTLYRHLSQPSSDPNQEDVPLVLNCLIFIDEFDKICPRMLSLDKLISLLDGDHFDSMDLSISYGMGDGTLRLNNWNGIDSLDLSRMTFVLAGNMDLESVCRKFDPQSSSLISRLEGSEILFEPLSVSAKTSIVMDCKVPEFCTSLELQLNAEQLSEIHQLCTESQEPGVRHLLHRVQDRLSRFKLETSED